MLEVLGLAPDEQELYEQLVSCPPLTLDEVCELVECHGAAAGGPTAIPTGSLTEGPTAAPTACPGACPTAGLLERLREFGLVSSPDRAGTADGGPVRWSATPPNAALQVLISNRDRELAEARRYLADVTSRFSRNHTEGNPPAMVEVIYGREEIVRRGYELQRVTRHEIRACDAPPYPADDAAAVNTMELDHLRRGIRYRILYDRRALDIPGRLADLEAGIAAGEQARVTDIPLKMTLSDHPVAILPLRSPPDVESRLIVHDSVLLDALSALFEMYWDQALPLRVSQGRAELPGDEGLPSAEERHLLPLLVAGLTDQEIAAQLGVSDRTVRSRVRAMMGRLDAATRFQAGYQAVQRRWLAVDDTAPAEVAALGEVS